MKTVVKEISRKIFRRIALESGPIVHLGGGRLIYLPKLGSVLSRTKSFCFVNDVFLTFGLGMCE